MFGKADPSALAVKQILKLRVLVGTSLLSFYMVSFSANRTEIRLSKDELTKEKGRLNY